MHSRHWFWSWHEEGGAGSWSSMALTWFVVGATKKKTRTAARTSSVMAYKKKSPGRLFHENVIVKQKQLRPQYRCIDIYIYVCIPKCSSVMVSLSLARAKENLIKRHDRTATCTTSRGNQYIVYTKARIHDLFRASTLRVSRSTNWILNHRAKRYQRILVYSLEQKSHTNGSSSSSSSSISCRHAIIIQGGV
jgi:hypothetical protein